MQFASQILSLVALWPNALGLDIDRDYFSEKCSYTTNFKMDQHRRAAAVNREKLTNEHLKNIGSIIDAWRQTGDGDINRLAFILATARRESSGTWKPIREVPNCKSESCREAAIGRILLERGLSNGSKPRPNYALPAANGQRYYGRGYIQLTHQAGYQYADKMLGSGTALTDRPDRVMEPDIAAKIIVRAMLEGWYGSKKPLSYYLNADKKDWINARNNVNPKSPNKPVTAASAQELVKCLRLK